ncbi:hypothetical protein F0562_015199 [Nyssa sinensis]|uniref:Nudix hydrolase domain-containing protein n=1 Tax=Nyssa sinensis TaxID=561372 RepID=A0A5J4ZJS0_9ASTE|nr:hypothetical protein F0562_015199 [Nyssa sinensis]
MALNAASTCLNGEMGCQNQENWGSTETLRSLAKQFELYKAAGSVNDEETDHENINDDGITECLAAKSDHRYCSNSDSVDSRRAAVLICLFEGRQGPLCVPCLIRPSGPNAVLTPQRGEVALPGGKMEEGDVDDSATALREAMEEIGLDPGLVQVVGTLEPFISQHLLSVVPVVALLGRMGDFEPKINTDEVDAIFDVPLQMFLEEDGHRCEEREWRGWKYGLHLFDYESEQGAFLIWGLTASILIRAATVIYQRPPSFTHHLPDFQHLQRAFNTMP